MTNPTQKTLLPENIQSLKAYSSAKSEKLDGTTWLNANESPYTRVINPQFTDLNRYPDPQPEGVINGYAKYSSLESEQVLMTRGADEGIELLVRTFCTPAQDSIAIFLPTYGMYKVTADTHNIGINGLSQTLLLEGSVSDIVEKIGDSKLVFICNPNNPTGSLTPINKIADIAQALAGKSIIVVDEAYIEFCEAASSTSLIGDFDNIVILRTLSKAFALAGLRTGFMLASASLLEPVKKVIAPYPVSSVVAAIAEQALLPDAITQMRRQVTILNDAKKLLIEWLKQSPSVTKVLSGEGNFVTLRLKTTDSLANANAMGLVMRPFTLYDTNDWLRISIGNEQELKVVKEWLETIQNI